MPTKQAEGAYNIFSVINQKMSICTTRTWHAFDYSDENDEPSPSHYQKGQVSE